ncbi:pyruvate dehydrogenase E2 component (dihydrolipoamide acetyltransferase) [Salinibacterium amurskyense]|uniref:Dihydrolipoamide acetyltransferase component of pyruvate dehydrogenase complex n=1 Tax=Salinibacterium amurskyense TaxID=205941 RepID=A0A2M9D640_9MICO|nr:dihydrolipoamide acetyltransferase family protein [Salinibacterium amurskyense]PJJ81098.1 pyruvate dehydrogenase E2 component (dihydrolipoamide acetyltransferase) [Salinibacterium amurskyense]RLQ83127.1 2-oxo acid dehydrogenase subunit E2 [Salinibacterium amurskyense]GHD81602.1 dihydrolipoamide acetyltransferase component of pyruvate dehydrogenase complex [Salinibacterium amurskyense]
MAVSEFPLPDVGEGLTEAEIVSWKVAPGDEITVNQVLVEIETAKSLVELPSPFAGTVQKLLVEEGATVEVGTPIISVQSVGGSVELTAPGSGEDESHGMMSDVGTESSAADDAAAAVADTASTIANEDDKPGAVLVGYGTGGHVSSRRRKGGQPAKAETAAAAAKPRPASVPASFASPIIAKPPIRKLAKDLGVELAEVAATGLAGETTREDVIRHASQASVFRNIETPAWGDEREERIPVKGVRKAIAKAMVHSAFTAPHVSVFTDVDATRTMEFVKRLKNSPDFAGVRVSPLLIMAKAVNWAVRRNPTVNSSWTDKEIIVHHYVNLGIAAATPRGLIVPNIKDAQDLSLFDLAKALEQLTLTARDGKTQPAEMSNGTITITNIGSYGMDTGTPIINPGEAAIVALGSIKQKPWVVDGEVRARYVTTVSASFDHRIVDGDVASRFVADLASVLEEPALLLD